VNEWLGPLFKSEDPVENGETPAASDEPKKKILFTDDDVTIEDK
jgi:hypothetical protein